MSQPMQSPRSASPLTARLYHLEYPRSLGVYSTYQEVQSVVDTLADNQFPVQSTLIVGTDLKLMERVTGRKTWGRVIWQGVLSGLWMGLFLGLLLLLITPGEFTIVLTSILMGIVFFTVWTVIGYAMTGGKRDFTSMTATIPMQYELLVEHKHAEQARRILAESGAGPSPLRPTSHSPGQSPVPAAAPQAGSQSGSSQQFGSPQTFGEPQPFGKSQPFGASTPASPHAPGQQADVVGAGSPPAAAPSRPSYGAPARPTYGQPAPGTAPAQAPSRGGRPSFGQPAVGGSGSEQGTTESHEQGPHEQGSHEQGPHEQDGSSGRSER